MIIQICFFIFVTCLTQMTIAMSMDQDIHSSEDGEENYIVDDCGWLGVNHFTEYATVIKECGNPPRNCTMMVPKNGVKAKSHQHQWQVLVGDESDKCNQLGMDF